jgi:Zn finger protein HypA/HybF involved in hydrogenase expression
MHEASIAKYVLEIVQETVDSDPNCQDKRIKSITFALSHPYTVYPDSFEFYFTELIREIPHLSGMKLNYVDSSEKGFFVSSIDFED